MVAVNTLIWFLDALQKWVDEKTNLYIAKLNELKDSGLLSEEELHIKKNEITQKLLEIRGDLRKALENKEILFSTMHMRDLKGVEIMFISKLSKELKDGDVFLKSKKTNIIRILDFAELRRVIEYGNTDEYWLILTE